VKPTEYGPGCAYGAGAAGALVVVAAVVVGASLDGDDEELQPVARPTSMIASAATRWREPDGEITAHVLASPSMVPGSVVVTLAALTDRWPDLRDVTIIGVDLTEADFRWPEARLAQTTLLGCALPAGVTDQLLASGAAVFPAPGGLPFSVYRSALYSYDELTAVSAGASGANFDERVGSWFRASSTGMHDAMIRAAHDATVDAAVARFVTGRRVVGVMGGHALDRGAPLYRTVAELGRGLTRAGFTVATGGGPGVMEAANLGAWMAAFPDDALDDALALLATSPSYADDRDGYRRCALDVRSRWPVGGVSLGVPTWVYLDEPTSAFATHIAKYFTNSIREDGLLAIARSGCVYAPGGAGTEQEIFTDTAQNSLTLYKVRSPMVFFGREFFEHDHPELVAAARRQAATFDWAELIAVSDDPREVVAFVEAHDPDAAGQAGIERRRTHQAG
jgi:predicted Rossmann-fold nucleotide-binding protein